MCRHLPGKNTGCLKISSLFWLLDENGLIWKSCVPIFIFNANNLHLEGYYYTYHIYSYWAATYVNIFMFQECTHKARLGFVRYLLPKNNFNEPVVYTRPFTDFWKKNCATKKIISSVFLVKRNNVAHFLPFEKKILICRCGKFRYSHILHVFENKKKDNTMDNC